MFLIAENFKLKVEKQTYYHRIYLLVCCKKLERDAARRYGLVFPGALLHCYMYFLVLITQCPVVQVEFRSVVSTSKDLQFSVEVSDELSFYSIFGCFFVDL